MADPARTSPRPDQGILTGQSSAGTTRTRSRSWWCARTGACGRTWCTSRSSRWASPAGSAPPAARSRSSRRGCGRGSGGCSGRGWSSRGCGCSGTGPKGLAWPGGARICGARGWRGRGSGSCSRSGTAPCPRSWPAWTPRCAAWVAADLRAGRRRAHRLGRSGGGVAVRRPEIVAVRRHCGMTTHPHVCAGRSAVQGWAGGDGADREGRPRPHRGEPAGRLPDVFPIGDGVSTVLRAGQCAPAPGDPPRAGRGAGRASHRLHRCRPVPLPTPFLDHREEPAVRIRGSTGPRRDAADARREHRRRRDRR